MCSFPDFAFWPSPILASATAASNFFCFLVGCGGGVGEAGSGDAGRLDLALLEVPPLGCCWLEAGAGDERRYFIVSTLDAEVSHSRSQSIETIGRLFSVAALTRAGFLS
jgi:hypothetical protein